MNQPLAQCQRLTVLRTPRSCPHFLFLETEGFDADHEKVITESV